MTKKVVVIGGGIAGLNAGIELLQHGYQVSLYEKNNEVGGLCSGYFIDGYNIDACFHWVMGTKKNTILNSLWTNNGGFDENTEMSHLPCFATFMYKGTKITFSRNLDEEEERWLALSKKDEKAIKIFFDTVRSLAYIWDITQNVNSKRFNIDILKVLPNSASILKSMKMSRETYAKRFTHPALRFAIKNAMTGYNNVYFFMQVYGLFSTGDGDVPLGGAYYTIQRVKNKFLSLGGELHLNNPVEQLIVEDKSVKYALVNKQKVEADYYVSALDINYVLKVLLNDKYRIKMYQKLNKSIDDNAISSCFCVYIKVVDYLSNIDVPTNHKIKPIKVGKSKVDALLIRPYDFDKTFDYQGAAVISLFIDQNQDDYLYYKSLRNYQKEKERIINDLISTFTSLYPEYKDKVTFLTAFSPIELNSRFNSSFGALQSYSFTDKTLFHSFKGRIKSISNLYMCGQRNRSIGGTPTALLSSHKTVKQIIKSDQHFHIFKSKEANN